MGDFEENRPSGKRISNTLTHCSKTQRDKKEEDERFYFDYFHLFHRIPTFIE